MADGDYTIPTYPGVVGLNTGGGGHNYGHGRRGFEGKDATFVAALASDNLHARTLEAIRQEGKDVLREVLQNRHESEKGQHLLSLRIADMRCDLKDEIRCEGDKTRDLLRTEALIEARARIARLEAKLDCPPVVPVPTPAPTLK